MYGLDGLKQSLEHTDSYVVGNVIGHKREAPHGTIRYRAFDAVQRMSLAEVFLVGKSKALFWKVVRYTASPHGLFFRADSFDVSEEDLVMNVRNATNANQETCYFLVDRIAMVDIEEDER